MPIETEFPSIRPPSADELDPDATSAPGTEGVASPSAAPTVAPPIERPTFQSDPSAFRGEESSEALKGFASEGLAAPSRFDSELVQDISGLIDTDLSEKKLYAGSELDEFASQRGLTGSNIELDARRSMIGDFERQRTERLTDLEMAAAQTWAQDRQAAADIGFRSAEFERALGGDRESAARFEATFGQGQYEFEQRAQMEQKALDLQSKGMDQDEAFRYAALSQDAHFTEAAQALQKQGLDETEAFRRAELEERKSQFAQQFGLNKQEYESQLEQFDKMHGEQIATRLQQASQFSADLKARLSEGAANRALESSLRGRAMDLQAQGMAMDQAYRNASLAQEKEIADRAHELTAQGMGKDDAYRYAALASDDAYRNDVIQNQEDGMAQDDAHHKAEIDQRDRQFDEATNNERLGIVLDALGNDNIDNEEVQKWLNRVDTKQAVPTVSPNVGYNSGQYYGGGGSNYNEGGFASDDPYFFGEEEY